MRHKHITNLVFLIIILSFFLQNCASGDSGELKSITLSPENQSCPKKAGTDSLQFTATGHYTDDSTQTITEDVEWKYTTISETSTENTTFMSSDIKGLFYLNRVGSYSIIATKTVTVEDTENTTNTATTKNISGITTLNITTSTSGSCSAIRTLSGISIKPLNPVRTSSESDTIRFTAIGAFSDGGTGDITDEVTWSIDQSSDTLKDSTINGLFNLKYPGTFEITATKDTYSATTTLTVQ